MPSKHEVAGSTPAGRATTTGKEASGPRDTIECLQAGRGLAALAVLFWHSVSVARTFGNPNFVNGPTFDGYLGVDFFFVLSGFIIYHSTVGRERSAKDFAIARFRRVYLPYWPIGIGIALIYVLFPTLSAGTREWSWLPTLTLAPVDSDTALLVAWTLKFEVLFYLLFGLFYFSGLLPLGLVAWACGIILYRQHTVFDPTNFEFFFGIGAAVLYRRRLASRWLLLAVPLLLYGWIRSGGGEEHRLWIGAMLACVVAAFAQIERNGHLSIPRPLMLLGAASYSIYLVHDPLISVVARLISGALPIMLTSVAVGLGGGFAYHFAVEKRVIRKKTNPEVFAGSSAEQSAEDVGMEGQAREAANGHEQAERAEHPSRREG